jgi:uncharacterized protein (TIGR02246 family)
MGEIMSRAILGFLVLMPILAGCAAPPQPDAQAVRAIIEEKNAALEQWYAQGDIDAASMVFSEDTWQMPPNSPPIVGRQAFRDFWTEAAGWGTWQFQLEVQDVAVSGPIAVERGKYRLTFTAGPEAPFPSTADYGNYVVYWRQDPDGEWRIVWDAPVSELPPVHAEPMD